MTITTVVSYVTYDGDAAVLTFPYPFKVNEESHLYVSIGGVDIPQADATYPWSPTDIGVGAGGNVVFSSTPPPVGVDNVYIYRNVPSTQETDYTPFDDFPAESHEAALDKLTMLIQEAEAGNNRAVSILVDDGGAYYTGGNVELVLQEIGADIVTNAADIATNAADIVTNAGDIATNTTAIATGPTYIANDNPPDTTMFPIITGTNAPGLQVLSSDANFKWNALSNILTVPTVVADLTGNASTATLASTITVTNDTTAADQEILFANGVGSKAVNAAFNQLIYNPSTSAFKVIGSVETITLIINGITVTKSAGDINRSLYLPDTASPAIANVATRASKFLGFDAAGEIIYSAGTTTVSASAVGITDAGGYYAATEVEAALQEVVEKVGVLNTKILDIGDWNMNVSVAGDPSVTVAHVLTQSKIRAINIIIRSDEVGGASTYYSYEGTADDVNIYIASAVGGQFDNGSFDDTSYNRGWITIQYTD